MSNVRSEVGHVHVVHVVDGVGPRDRAAARPQRASHVESGRPRRARRVGATAVLALGTLAVSVVGAASASADPSPGQIGSQLQDAQAKAAQITAQMQTDSQRLDVLDQQYEEAQQQVQAIDASLLETTAKIADTQAAVNDAKAQLRRQAVEVYTGGSSDEALSQLFAPGGERSSLVHEYQQVASNNITETVDQLHAAETVLGQQQSQLQATEAQKRASAAQLGSAQSQAQAVTASEQDTLNHVNGQIASLVSQQQAAAQAAQAAAFQAQFGAPTNVAVAPGAAGAVQAAESQLGVPYEWGGEQPGAGFDCSGLTQWSWGQAGVSIPRTAQEQYDAIAHVPISGLEPGDLVFWDDGTSSVQHVAMYVGNNTVIQAPYSGQTVSYSPMWTNGLVGAGRP